jgi:fatty acid amide hydrolase
MRLLKSRMRDARVMPQIKPLLTFSSLPRAAIAGLQSLLRVLGQPSLAAGLEGFGHTDTAHYWLCVEALHDYRASFRAAMDTAAGGPLDLILCPPCPLPAFTHGATKDLATAGAYACLYNLLGYPAGVVPVTRVREDEQVGRDPSRDAIEKAARRVEQGSAGLPVGVQVVARPWWDHVALAAMAQIERVARPRPDYPAYAGD